MRGDLHREREIMEDESLRERQIEVSGPASTRQSIFGGKGDLIR